MDVHGSHDVMASVKGELGIRNLETCFDAAILRFDVATLRFAFFAIASKKIRSRSLGTYRRISVPGV